MKVLAVVTTLLVVAKAFPTATIHTKVVVVANNRPDSALRASKKEHGFGSSLLFFGRHSRRSALSQAFLVTCASTVLLLPQRLLAASVADEPLKLDPILVVDMKDYSDPLFSMQVPANFFTLRRQQKGDLPNEKTGAGRRGSSIFTAGNMAKAEVIAVER
jgi:hypothetical protein